MPHELTTNKKKIIFLKCHLSFYETTTKHFLIRLWCATKRGFYMTTSTNLVAGPRRSSKALPKAKLAPKKGHGHCLVVCWVCCHSDPLGLPEFQQNHYIWEVCLTNQWDGPKPTMPAASIGQQKGPNSSLWQSLTAHHTSKFEWNGLPSFILSAIFTWPLTNWILPLQASWKLCSRNAATSSRTQKMLLKSSLNLKAIIFMLQE